MNAIRPLANTRNLMKGLVAQPCLVTLLRFSVGAFVSLMVNTKHSIARPANTVRASAIMIGLKSTKFQRIEL